jgi:hypothetical protein
MVASGVDFFVGITAAGDELVVAVSVSLFFAAGDDDLVGEAEAVDFGAGDALFSVVTETVGSLLFSAALDSGEAAGDGLSSWANATGTAAANSVITARTVIFIWFSLLEFAGSFGLTRR